MAQRHPYNTSNAALLTPADLTKNPPFFENWNLDTDTANHDLLCAEMSRLAYAEPDIVKKALAPIGFVPIGFIGDNAPGTEGFAAKHPVRGLTVLAFRGTESNQFADLLSDGQTLQIDYRRGSKTSRVHTGFTKAYAPPEVQALIAKVREERVGQLLVTGHSLGAALATLAPVDTTPDKLITFGSPHVGDADFRAWFSGLTIHRYVNCCDVVGRVPPEQFNAANFSKLFAELGFASFASSALGRALGWLHLPGNFVHVAPPRFIFSDGHVEDDPTMARQETDQKAARETYPRADTNFVAQLKDHLSSLPMPTRPGILSLLKKIFSGSSQTSAAAMSIALTGLRSFVEKLFSPPTGGQSPLRDLAGHAPINYFSGIAGRLR